ncbi:MAG: 3-oxoacyl-ACP synthase [Burkholderiales bacterium 12-64-5]|nr:MAG: 3-oxoacyl-ACP synthase [Burkholderiales bacterium 12-64-5]
MFAAITNIACHLPETVLTNEELAPLAEHWTPEKIYEKTGIRERHIAADDECASDLAFHAAERLLQAKTIARADIDYVVFCTQLPDYPLPTTACLLQDRLGLPTTCGAVDINLGCSGYVYALGLVQGLIETGQATNVLLLTGETYSKVLRDDDVSVRTLFGDAGTATLVQAVTTDDRLLGPYVYGSDGRGGPNLMLKRHAWRNATVPAGVELASDSSNGDDEFLTMNGPEIFTFTLKAVPAAVKALLQRAERSIEEVDLFVFHQANRYMLTHLRNKLGIDEDRFVIAMEHVGNTVSSTIPYALSEAQRTGRLTPGKLVMLVGFGVGYSWGATLLRWHGAPLPE